MLLDSNTQILALNKNSVADFVSTTLPNLVAEAGLEPRDLRVMSPTSYQLLYSATLCVVLTAGLEPARMLLRWILNPLRLPIPPREQDLIHLKRKNYNISISF